ncbi:MAG: glucosyltransferase domain-containing protein [Synergistaceae bacterium]|nr:glucosyltransferase domain-containing protein [Synergistaceae bacterium]
MSAKTMVLILVCVALIIEKIDFDNIAETFKKHIRPFIKPFGIVYGINLIALSALFRANFYYIDDMGRACRGYKGWEGFSRFTANFLSRWVHASNYLTDVSPLTQFIAIGIMTCACIILLYAYTAKKTYNVWHYIAVIPLCLSPYFLECISYKYDSPYMALSVLASVLPLLFRKKNICLYAVSVITGVLVVCTTYQAACGIFPMFVVVFLLRDWNSAEADNKQLLKNLAISVIAYGIGLLIFKRFIMKPVDTYVSNSISCSLIIPHFKQYYKLIFSDFKKSWLIFLAVIIAAYIAVFTRDSKRDKFAAFALAVLSVAIICLTPFGLYPAIERPLMAPRAMYGFGALICLFALVVSNAKRIYWGKIATFFLAWTFFVFAFTYGNALYMQAKYTDYRICLITNDLNELDICKTDITKELQISGWMGYAPAVKNIPADCGILRRLIPVTLCQEWSWGSCGLANYYGLKNIKIVLGTDFSKMQLPILKQTSLHTIKGDDARILVEIH